MPSPPRQNAHKMTIHPLQDKAFKSGFAFSTLPSSLCQLDGFQGPSKMADQLRGRDLSLQMSEEPPHTDQDHPPWSTTVFPRK